jgi:hypothetical protein
MTDASDQNSESWLSLPVTVIGSSTGTRHTYWSHHSHACQIIEIVAVCVRRVPRVVVAWHPTTRRAKRWSVHLSSVFRHSLLDSKFAISVFCYREISTLSLCRISLGFVETIADRRRSDARPTHGRIDRRIDRRRTGRVTGLRCSVTTPYSGGRESALSAGETRPGIGGNGPGTHRTPDMSDTVDRAAAHYSGRCSMRCSAPL